MPTTHFVQPLTLWFAYPMGSEENSTPMCLDVAITSILDDYQTLVF